MSIRKLPQINALQNPLCHRIEFEPSERAEDMWSPVALADDPNMPTIAILEQIGEDIFGDGFSAKRMSAILRSIGPKDVKVRISSPGGNLFEGITIYNQLAAHPAKVFVEVLGIAASAASLIAMAGDEIAMGRGSFIMVHNAEGIVLGGKAEMREAAEVFAQFDSAMADIYSARTGLDEKEIAKLMDKETFLTAKEAEQKGFADSIFDRKDGQSNQNASAALEHTPDARKEIDIRLRRQSVPRAERRRLLRELTDFDKSVEKDQDGKPRAVSSGLVAEMSSFNDWLKSQ